MTKKEISELSDIQSESAVIGTLLYHPDFIFHTESLLPKHFYGTENACIYWAIQELSKEGVKNIDAYMLSTKLQSNSGISKALDKYNLPAVQEFTELYKETARDDLKEYKLLANNILSLSFKRDLVKSLDIIKRECYNKEVELDKLSNDVYTKLDDLTESYIVADEIETLGANISQYWDEIVERRTDNGLYGIPSKYNVFNKYFTYEKGELVLIQARMKQGKSIMLMNEVVHKVKNGVPTLVVDTEMPTRLYVERLLAHLSQVDIHKIKSGNYNDVEGQRIEESLNWIKNAPFVHKYEPNITNEKLFSICKMLKYRMGLTFVVYDYIKSNETSASDNYNILGAKCDFLKNRIAGELDLAVLSACQLGRNNQVADSDKINRYISTGIKWGRKPTDIAMRDGNECGDYQAKVYVNRLGEQMAEDDDDEYLDFFLDGKLMTITEAKQHEKTENGFD